MFGTKLVLAWCLIYYCFSIPTKKKMVDYRITVIYKDGIDAFKCVECIGSFKSRTWAKKHLTKKHRARTDDDQDDKEEKNKRMGEELYSINKIKT